MNFIKKLIFYSRDVLAVLVLLVVYHGYELWCYLIGNMFRYYVAVAICAGTLGLVSMGLIYLHAFFSAPLFLGCFEVAIYQQLGRS